MVICCPGAIDSDIHCDNSKGNKEITFNLFSTELENSISYRSKDGLIKSSNATWDKELNEVLNLNNTRLKQNRNEVINGLVDVLKMKGWNKATIRKELESWQSLNKHHKFKPYCGVIIWYLKKKLNS